MIDVTSLWGDDFSIQGSYADAKKLLNKIKHPKDIRQMPVDKIMASKNISFSDKLPIVEENVHKVLGQYENDMMCIYTRQDFHDYITKAIYNGIISIDTETIGTRTDIKKPGTDPFTCKICGLCLYTPDEKSVYIPINHMDYNVNVRFDNQLTEKDVYEEMSRLVEAETFNIFHNGKFDYMVIYYTCGIKIPITWDTMIGSQLLNENEPAGLKFQYRDKINPDQEKYDIDKLFDLDKLGYYPPELFKLYAAQDAKMTYQLYEYQRKEFKKSGNEKLYKLFTDIEMPVVTVTAEMEMRGVAVDKEFSQRLSTKFHKKLDELNITIENEMAKYKDIISTWRKTPEANYQKIINGKSQKSLNEKLSDPIQLSSPTQLGILLYDVLKVLKADKEGKKSTDEAALLSIKDKLPLADMILQLREYEKYLGTYIDVLPTYCNPYDDRVHAHFNQMGREDRNVVTGRMSSSDPSLQVIPARGDIVSVRCLFVPTLIHNVIKNTNGIYTVPIEDEVLLSNGEYKFSSYLISGDVLDTKEIVNSVEVKNNLVYITVDNPVLSGLNTQKRYKMMGNDFSSQEVRMFAANTQDPAMIKVFNEGRDLYSEVASMVYHLPYNQCTEFDENGEFNLEGKKRRTACKSLILGLQYGRGIGSIAEQIKSHPGKVTKEDKDEAQKLSDDFFHNYPMAKKWMEGNYEKAEKQGYVEDLWGRRRRLPDASLPKYQFELISEESNNPLLGSADKKNTISKSIINKYTIQLDKARSKEAREIICSEALNNGIKIKCNSGYIAQARRQSINAPIQGGSATMTKLAMRDMYNDKELNQMDFHLLIPVHDELIAEAPVWYAEEANKRMAYLMIHAGEPECKVPMKCDGDCWDFWYQDVIDAHIEEDFTKAIDNGKTKTEALAEVQGLYSEFESEYVSKVLNNKCSLH